LFRAIGPSPYRRHLPVYSLAIAAGAFRDNAAVEEEGWIEVPPSIRPREGMFVARVAGRSMESRIPDGSYAVFRPAPAGDREGKILLVELEGMVDPEGVAHTVKRWHSEHTVDPNGETWRHAAIALESLNPEFKPLLLDPAVGYHVIAEFVDVLRSEA
jgi:SOS-response transcriptional repressor LexA